MRIVFDVPGTQSHQGIPTIIEIAIFDTCETHYVKPAKGIVIVEFIKG